SKKHPKKNALNPLVIRHFRGVFSQNQVQNSGGFSINPEKFAGGFGKWRMFKVEGFSLSCYNGGKGLRIFFVEVMLNDNFDVFE
ncbi:MAG: hypothetical protein FWF59_08755, partial [Turicibacter sp.]|nr:hypothetical protein [Turicibacter sp.]